MRRSSATVSFGTIGGTMRAKSWARSGISAEAHGGDGAAGERVLSFRVWRANFGLPSRAVGARDRVISMQPNNPEP